MNNSWQFDSYCDYNLSFIHQNLRASLQKRQDRYDALSDLDKPWQRQSNGKETP
jgi:hypothetical protein